MPPGAKLSDEERRKLVDDMFMDYEDENLFRRRAGDYAILVKAPAA